MSDEQIVENLRRWYSGEMGVEEATAFFQRLVDTGLIAYMSESVRGIARGGVEDGLLKKSEAAGTLWMRL